MPGAALEVRDKKRNKTWWPHSTSSRPVADTANEQTVTVLCADCWVLSAEIRVRPREGGDIHCIRLWT